MIDGAIGVLLVFMKGRSSRWINSALEQATASDQAGFVVRALKNLLWPDGVWGEPAEPYSAAQAAKDRVLSRKRLLESIPEQLTTLLTSGVVSGGAQKLHGMLQCPRITSNLVYTIVDMLLLRLFPDISVEGLYNLRSGK